jgi:hypothetical protein
MLGHWYYTTYVQCTFGIWVLRTVYTYSYDQGDGILGHGVTTQPEMCYFILGMLLVLQEQQ